jgi:hypothetical protein
MELQKGNSRMLFLEELVSQIDIARAIAPIDLQIFDSAKIQLAGHEIIIDFEQNPTQDNFMQSKVRIGREILGFDSQVFSQFQYQDFDKRKVKVFPIHLHSDWNQFFEEAKSFVFSVDKWRLVIQDDFSSAQIELD